MAAPDAELIVVATFLNKVEADLAKGALEAADIDSLIQGDDAAGARPALSMGGVRLLVRASDAESAREILYLPAEQPPKE
jgi:Putative prokaryotic signal transducing protein